MQNQSDFNQLSRIIQETYKNRKMRRTRMPFRNMTLDYQRGMSNNRFSYYTTTGFVLFSIHGADNLSLNITAIKKYINENMITDDVNSICHQYRKVLPELVKNNAIMICAHSLGCYISAECMKKTRPYKSVFFAPYIPKKDGNTSYMMANNDFKKLIYTSDPFAKNGLEIKPQRNLFVFERNNIFFKTSTNGGHSITVYTTDFGKDFIDKK